MEYPNACIYFKDLKEKLFCWVKSKYWCNNIFSVLIIIIIIPSMPKFILYWRQDYCQHWSSNFLKLRKLSSGYTVIIYLLQVSWDVEMLTCLPFYSALDLPFNNMDCHLFQILLSITSKQHVTWRDLLNDMQWM